MMSYKPAQCGSALKQWIGQERATYTGYLRSCEEAQSPPQSVYVTIDIDADGVTLTRDGSSEGPDSYRFNADTATIRWGIEGPSRTLSDPICDEEGTVTSAEMLLTEADDTRMQGQISRTGAGSAAE
jgi:hypothetical protein